MAFYWRLRQGDVTEGRHTAQRLLQLQQLFREGAGAPLKPDYVAPIPPRTLSDTLLLATWNIREFDSSKYGLRSQESLYYIAEIISRFDLVAIQEVQADLSALETLCSILGGQMAGAAGRRRWKYLVTDVTEGVAGNNERMAFLYDERKVRFTGLAGEITLPPKGGSPVRQLARSPFLVGFESGWLKFALCTVHILYGRDDPNHPQRIEEIDAIARFLARRVKRYRERFREQGKSHSEYENILLIGDFNIYSESDLTFKALASHGFSVPSGILGKRTNIGKKGKTFDQIAFLEEENNLEFTDNAGVFDFSREIYRTGDIDWYAPMMTQAVRDSNKRKSANRKSTPYAERTDAEKRRYYSTWRTFQMSDHFPLWIELRINSSQQFLEKTASGSYSHDS